MAELNTAMADAMNKSKQSKTTTRLNEVTNAINKAKKGDGYALYQLANDKRFRGWNDPEVNKILDQLNDGLKKKGFVNDDGSWKSNSQIVQEQKKNIEKAREDSDKALGVQHTYSSEGGKGVLKNIAQENMAGADDGIEGHYNPDTDGEYRGRNEVNEDKSWLKTTDDWAKENVKDTGIGIEDALKQEPNQINGTADGNMLPETEPNPSPEPAGEQNGDSKGMGGNKYLLADMLFTALSNMSKYRPSHRTAYGQSYEGQAGGNEKSLAQKMAEENLMRGLERRNARQDYDAQTQAQIAAAKAKGGDKGYLQAMQNQMLSTATENKSGQTSSSNVLGSQSNAWASSNPYNVNKMNTNVQTSN